MAVRFMQVRRPAVVVLALDLTTSSVAVHCYGQEHDFYEGVRCMLVEKGSVPKWAPSTFAEVSDEAVSRYFDDSPRRSEL